MKQLKEKIVWNKIVEPDFCKMRIKSGYLAKSSLPGQFIEVRCSDTIDPLLRRPFGIHRILNDGVEILYEIVGKGTEILSKRKSGDKIDVIGPLGNGFDLNAIRYPLNAILVAGGIGVAPLLALAQRIADRKNNKMYVLIGAKSKSHILCKNEFKKSGAKVLISTEDGSEGKKGLVTELLEGLLTAYDLPLTTIYACGPSGMLKAVSGIAIEKRIPCQISLEERMACGVGVCLGCPVKIKRGSLDYTYKMVCKDGPVFNAEEIKW